MSVLKVFAGGCVARHVLRTTWRNAQSQIPLFCPSVLTIHGNVAVDKLTSIKVILWSLQYEMDYPDFVGFRGLPPPTCFILRSSPHISSDAFRAQSSQIEVTL
jgi:hypothetical protein